MVKTQMRAYQQAKKQIARLIAIVKEALSSPKREDMTWRMYFWGEYEAERYSLPIK